MASSIPTTAASARCSNGPHTYISCGMLLPLVESMYVLGLVQVLSS